MDKVLSDPACSSLVDVKALLAKVVSRYLSWPLIDGHVVSWMTDNVIPQVSSSRRVSVGKS